MTGIAHKILQRWYSNIYGITKMHLLQEDNTQISHVLLQTKIIEVLHALTKYVLPYNESKEDVEKIT